MCGISGPEPLPSRPASVYELRIPSATVLAANRHDGRFCLDACAAAQRPPYHLTFHIHLRRHVRWKQRNDVTTRKRVRNRNEGRRVLVQLGVGSCVPSAVAQREVGPCVCRVAREYITTYGPNQLCIRNRVSVLLVDRVGYTHAVWRLQG